MSPNRLGIGVGGLGCSPLALFSDQNPEPFELLLVFGDQDMSSCGLACCFDAEVCQ